jgi:hypothetical protein
MMGLSSTCSRLDTRTGRMVRQSSLALPVYTNPRHDTTTLCSRCVRVRSLPVEGAVCIYCVGEKTPGHVANRLADSWQRMENIRGQHYTTPGW